MAQFHNYGIARRQALELDLAICLDSGARPLPNALFK